jgi:TDG/mug DNA glycosylase family protein
VNDPTIAVYEARAIEWRREREADVATDGAEAFGAAARRAGRGAIADLGCGPGWHTGALGPGAIGLDASMAMLQQVPDFAPEAARVRADLRALPFRRGGLGAAHASKSYVHLPQSAVPLALADLHRSLAPGAPVELVLFEGDREHDAWPGDAFVGRRFSLWPERRLRDVLAGAGLSVERFERSRGAHTDQYRIRAVRSRTLPDIVGPGMRLLVCGLNPSLYAADRGIGFARPGNRFWPAALAAGLVARDRDPVDALRSHGIGMTDLVKRATTASAELSRDEYREGLDRVARLVDWLRPGGVCFVGLEGWRAAVDPKAGPGEQPSRLGGAPVYVMPSTSGLNAHSRVDDLTAHLRRASRLGSSLRP